MNLTYENNIQTANVLLGNQEYEKAIEYYQLALLEAPFVEHKIDILNVISRAFLTLNQIEKAVDTFEQSLRLHQELPEDKASILKVNKAAVLNNLGSLYLKKDVAKSIAYHKEALDVFTKAVAENTADYTLHLANTHLSLAEAFYNKKDFYLARKHYKAAIEIYTSFESDKAEISKPLKANAYYNLGDIASDENDMLAARENLTKALFLYQELTEKSPEAFRPLLAATHNNLAVVAKTTEKYGEAIRYYQSTLEQYEILVAENRAAFLPYYAASFNNLGIVYTQKHEVRDAMGLVESTRFSGFGTLSVDNFKDDEKEEETRADKKKAIEYYLQALNFYNELEENDSGTYTPYIATTLHNVAVLYDENQDYENAKKFYTEALQIRKRLAEQYPQSFDPDVCVTMLNIITMNQSLMEEQMDLKYKIESLQLLEEVSRRLDKYGDDRAVIKSMKSDTAYYQEYYKNADMEYLEVLQTFGKADELSEEINAVLKPEQKIVFQKQINELLEGLLKKYPVNERLNTELLNAYTDYAWLALRANDLDVAHENIQKGLKADEYSQALKINFGHYHLLKNEEAKAQKIYAEIIAADGEAEKVIEEDLKVLRSMSS